MLHVPINVAHNTFSIVSLRALVALRCLDLISLSPLFVADERSIRYNVHTVNRISHRYLIYFTQCYNARIYGRIMLTRCCKAHVVVSIDHYICDRCGRPAQLMDYSNAENPLAIPPTVLVLRPNAPRMQYIEQTYCTTRKNDA
jgi:hypothetical protein